MNGCIFFEIRCDGNMFGAALLVRKYGWRINLNVIVGPFIIRVGPSL